MVSVTALLLSFSLASALDYYKRCLVYNRTCVTLCPHFMHPYHTRCDRDTVSQRTCESPELYTLGYTCGWSRCDCNGEKLLDERTMHCVPLDNCPVLQHRKPEHLRGRNRKNRRHRSKKIVVSDDTDLIDIH